MLIFDAGGTGKTSAALRCLTCSKLEADLRPGNYLVAVGNPDNTSHYCKGCLEQLVQDNTRMNSKPNGVIEWVANNLLQPDTGEELPRFVRFEEHNFDLLKVLPPKEFTHYLNLERVRYDRPRGHFEGVMLVFGTQDEENDEAGFTFGFQSGCDVRLPSDSLGSEQFVIKFIDGKFWISDHPNSNGTCLRRLMKQTLDSYVSKRSFAAGEWKLQLTFKPVEELSPLGADLQAEHSEGFGSPFSKSELERGLLREEALTKISHNEGRTPSDKTHASPPTWDDPTSVDDSLFVDEGIKHQVNKNLPLFTSKFKFR